MLDRRSFVTLALGMVATPFALAACSSPKASDDVVPNESDAQVDEEQQSQVANPFVDCESAYEAAQIAGFEVSFPESVPGYEQRMYQAIEGELVQCFYHNGDDGPSVLIRKSVDDGTGDVSGNYNEYSQTASVNVGDLNVTEKGNDDLVYVAIWTKDGYAFAIDADEGLAADVVEGLVAVTL